MLPIKNKIQRLYVDYKCPKTRFRKKSNRATLRPRYWFLVGFQSSRRKEVAKRMLCIPEATVVKRAGGKALHRCCVRHLLRHRPAHNTEKWSRAQAKTRVADPEPAFHFTAYPDPNPDPLQIDGNLRLLVYDLHTLQGSILSLQASNVNVYRPPWLYFEL